MSHPSSIISMGEIPKPVQQVTSPPNDNINTSNISSNSNTQNSTYGRNHNKKHQRLCHHLSYLQAYLMTSDNCKGHDREEGCAALLSETHTADCSSMGIHIYPLEKVLTSVNSIGMLGRALLSDLHDEGVIRSSNNDSDNDISNSVDMYTSTIKKCIEVIDALFDRFGVFPAMKATDIIYYQSPQFEHSTAVPPLLFSRVLGSYSIVEENDRNTPRDDVYGNNNNNKCVDYLMDLIQRQQQLHHQEIRERRDQTLLMNDRKHQDGENASDSSDEGNVYILPPLISSFTPQSPQMPSDCEDGPHTSQDTSDVNNNNNNNNNNNLSGNTEIRLTRRAEEFIKSRQCNGINTRHGIPSAALSSTSASSNSQFTRIRDTNNNNNIVSSPQSSSPVDNNNNKNNKTNTDHTSDTNNDTKVNKSDILIKDIRTIIKDMKSGALNITSTMITDDKLLDENTELIERTRMRTARQEDIVERQLTPGGHKDNSNSTNIIVRVLSLVIPRQVMVVIGCYIASVWVIVKSVLLTMSLLLVTAGCVFVMVAFPAQKVVYIDREIGK